ncbi:MAG: DUF2279 domain-containing protein [Bacteroidetes bacterium]|nr:DUF2279 domain-containing protein [Bacteroidota bacterium]
MTSWYKSKQAILFCCLSFPLFAGAQQNDTSSFFAPAPQFNKIRFNTVIAVEAGLYAGTLAALGTLWYSNYPRSSFHFFNDNDEWLAMDKAGHVVTAYYIGRTGLNLMKWSGVERKKAIWYGGGVGSLYQSTLEILDGFSSQWGFSVGDLAANTLGSALLIGQELAWDEQRFSFKYSFHQTEYPQYRPNMLGNNFMEQSLKDYNGQTYWLSANVSSFLHKENKFPKWLNIAVGYSAEGMTGAMFNPPFDSGGNLLPVFERYRKIYLSLDVDLTRIKTRSHFLKTVFNVIGFIKIPAPALEFSEKGMKGWGIYF